MNAACAANGCCQSRALVILGGLIAIVAQLGRPLVLLLFNVLPVVSRTLYRSLLSGFFHPFSNSKMRIFRIKTRSRSFRLTYPLRCFLQPSSPNLLPGRSVESPPIPSLEVMSHRQG
ncbi:hypothetical protein ARMSODRAFT_522169 [Armillaria solidipes]|uniref:Uncharacterized protein n=1 Tax=Armillaria solidipes TaxID=1076256 RepID=A0A2H3B2K0_9AGAR|nr:hypothetical protein ARMSODRAFT_522169 [Armillaria solidipes]